ncbi:Uncharacterised protein [Serratia ficaria]|uniref:Uncharacterized protein n=1 Tax=Serratia ficaria TaxID=61651 RepID=A0A240BX89_SERFI|nr:hypothetical protein C7332_3411 [Serratia ficaria]CAI0725827.1 Uncharacterised protein [Serratia ficaria]CAI0754959.1 Uncharacterised protein [Serratia ficaria]CAI0857286.1 Uncharacterised protein [Serratia ficaria]CAI0908743.1 Uncharacterised protein [Serratia ficaria]
MTVQSVRAGVGLRRSEYGPARGRIALISHRLSRRPSSSFPAASLNDVKRLTAEDQEGKCHDD